MQTTRRTISLTTAAGLGLSLLVLALPRAWGADAADGPRATGEPAADLADLYAWLSPDAKKLNLVVTVWPAAPESAALSPHVQYVLHVRSGSAIRRMSREIPILCQTAGAELECWVGDTGWHVRGDASRREGLATSDGRLRVFAGLRDDPFFFNRGGFERFVETVVSWRDALAPLRDGAGCPTMSQEQSDTAWYLLQRGRDEGPPQNDHAGQRVVALVVQIDAALVATGGPILGVWASTRRRP
jgi:hypothetical protein